MDTDERVLCPDGTCTGLLDATGRCNACGRVGEVAPREADDAVCAVAGDDRAAPEAPDATPDEPDAAPPTTTVTAMVDADSFDDRALCPDGTCVGVLGADGVCGTCGRTA